MRFKYPYLIILITLSANPSLLYSQNRLISFSYLTVDDGLTDNYIQSILRDSKDYMWFGTRDHGLNKYNSQDVFIYKHNDSIPGSISHNDIRCIFEDSRGNLWIGTRNGLNLYNRDSDSFITFKHKPEDSTSLSGNWVTSIIEDKNGNLWIGTDQNSGLNKWLPGLNRFKHYPINTNNENVNANSITGICEDSNGNIWIVNRGHGIYKFDPLTITYSYFDDSSKSVIGNNTTKKITIDENGIIWIISSDAGVASFNTLTNEFRYYGTNIGLDGSDHKLFTDIIQEDENHLLISADQGGVSRFDKKKKTFKSILSQNNTQGLNSYGVRSLYKDKEGILWLGTSRGGVNIHNQKANKFNLVKHNTSDRISMLRNIIGWFYEDSQGLIWIATDGGGLDIYNPKTGTFKNFLHDPKNPFSISGDVLRCIDEDSEGNFWIGTWDAGLSKYDPKTNKFTRFNPNDTPESITSNTVWNLKVTKNDNIWVSCFDQGIDVINTKGKIINHFSRDPKNPGSLGDNNVWYIFEDAKNNIWLATSNGVNLYERNTQTFKKFNNFPDNDIRTIYRDSKGRLWAGSVSKGIFQFNMAGTVLKIYNESNGLPHNNIHAIVEDDNACLWVTTNKGLCCIDPESDECKSYHKRDGLQSDIFYTLSALKSRNGQIYVGGYNGFNSFFPDSLKTNNYIPKVYLTGLRIFNKTVTFGTKESALLKPINEAKEINLSWRQSVFTFEFIAINYTNSDNSNYAYKMDGFENNWNYIGNKRDATYTNLDPGQYVFQVKASNNDGIWNDEGTSIIVTIAPVFWQTWLFKTIIISSIMTAFVAFYKIRLARVRKQKAVLSKLVKERTMDLENANELLLETNSLLEEKQQQTEEQSEELKVQNEKLENQKQDLNNTILELQQTQMQLVQAEKMASLGILTAGVAHEINNPLNFIQAGLYAANNIIKNEKIQSKTLQTYLGHMNVGIDRVSAIVQSLKTISNKDNFSIKTCNIHKIIDNSLLILNHEIKYKCKITKNYTSEKYTLNGNEESLHQVFINLLMNSAQAIKEKGNIAIETKKTSNKLMITIVDDGIGISKESLNQIFDPFFTTKEPGKGTGLGLSIVYKIITDHNGQIKFSSEENKYTQVSIWLPLTD